MIAKIPLGSRILLFRTVTPTNSFIASPEYFTRFGRIIPALKRGPFYFTGLISWKWGEIELSLKRWL